MQDWYGIQENNKAVCFTYVAKQVLEFSLECFARKYDSPKKSIQEYHE
jgi:hypothetical protein